jgi:hypothetical protein
MTKTCKIFAKSSLGIQFSGTMVHMDFSCPPTKQTSFSRAIKSSSKRGVTCLTLIPCLFDICNPEITSFPIIPSCGSRAMALSQQDHGSYVAYTNSSQILQGSLCALVEQLTLLNPEHCLTSSKLLAVGPRLLFKYILEKILSYSKASYMVALVQSIIFKLKHVATSLYFFNSLPKTPFFFPCTLRYSIPSLSHSKIKLPDIIALYRHSRIKKYKWALPPGLVGQRAAFSLFPQRVFSAPSRLVTG